MTKENKAFCVGLWIGFFAGIAIFAFIMVLVTT